MTTIQKVTGRAISMQAGLCLGSIVSLMLTITGAALLAEMISREIVRWEYTGYWIMGILLTASFLGSWIASEKIKRRRILVSQLSAGIYFTILMAITALFFGGQYESVGVTAILVWGGSSVSALLKFQAKRVAVHRKVHKRYC